MRPKDPSTGPFIIGCLTSFGLHVIFAIITILVLQHNAANAAKESDVFSVTLEAGMNIGGVSQVPEKDAKKILTPEDTTPEKGATNEEKEEKAKEPDPEDEALHIKEPTVVDDPEKLIAEQKKLEEKKLKEQKVEQEKKEKEKKKKEDEKKKEEDKKKAEEEKKKDDAEKKKIDEDAKKDRAKRDKQLADRLRELKNKYAGESADAGGKGFGAAALGGKGMGGGTLASAEKIAYYNALKNHVKSGWRWLNSTNRLVAKVEVSILPDGRVQNVNITQSSGNPNFDDSVVRAVLKASPVPVAPANLYQEFSDVVFTFDSTE